MKPVVAALLLCLVALSATAQPVYRCGNEYSQSPCPQGKIVEATDPRTPAQRSEAQRAAASERRLAADLQRERLADQAARQPALAGSLGGPVAAPAQPVAAHKGHPSKRKRASAKPDELTDAIVVSPGAKKRRGRP